ncbi:ABC transporter ATP-binding protein [Streptomyces sp. RPT161]|uniref:ABC transporter ATP-binding protein n=1 Tax=Streptomyces sp. RPT161 TaxID=3015993 RepID=UPI0022B8D50E|nr:ATP-binding cassette domain-containing protein [Streptomyces sp. RPT161]
MVAPPDNDVLWGRGLRHSHQGSPALLGVSVGVRDGEILGIVGPRGAGKTTLLKCLSGQLVADEGEVWFNSAPVHTLPGAARERLRRECFGWVGSSPQLVPELTAWENAALPLLLSGATHRAARNSAQEWLDRLDVGECARRRPGDLLQAQRQRVAVARALVPLPEVIFADEPTAPLHRADRAQVLRTLTAAARTHGITVLLATHDPEVAAFTDRTVALVDGQRAAALPNGPWPEEGVAPCSASA